MVGWKTVDQLATEHGTSGEEDTITWLEGPIRP